MLDPSEHGVARVVHHKDYYIRGGDITFLVENHLFRVHSYFFERESTFFRQKLTTATTTGGEPVGTSDGNAYTLDDVRSDDFARFLWVFYNPRYSLYNAPLEGWLSILKLANRWSFGSVKDLAVRELEKLDIEPIEKIDIYHQHAIDSTLLIPSFIALCKREHPLTLPEGMKLGMETVLGIAEARERARRMAVERGVHDPTSSDIEDSEMEMMIRDVFKITSRPSTPKCNGTHVRSASLTLNELSLSPSTKMNGAAGTNPEIGTNLFISNTGVKGAAPIITNLDVGTPGTPLTATSSTAQSTTETTGGAPASGGETGSNLAVGVKEKKDMENPKSAKKDIETPKVAKFEHPHGNDRHRNGKGDVGKRVDLLGDSNDETQGQDNKDAVGWETNKAKNKRTK